MERGATDLSKVSAQLLETLLAVIREGSVAKAAAALDRPSKTVARDLARLEAAVGLPLANRSRRGVSPTPAGIAYAAEARKVLDGLARGSELARAAVRPDGATLRIGHLGWASHSLLLGALELLGAQRPGVGVELHVAISTTLIQDLEIGALDLVVCRPLGAPSILVAEYPLLHEPVVLAVPDGHRLAGYEKVPVEELATLEFIGPVPTSPSSSRPTNVPLYRRFGFVPRWTNDQADQPETMLLLVAAGRGVCLVSASVAGVQPVPGVTYLATEPTLRVPLSVLRRATQPADPLVDLLVDLLSVAAEDLRDRLEHPPWLPPRPDRA